LDHPKDIVGASHPPENVKRFEIGLMKLLAECRAGIAHDNDFEIAIRCLASRGADTNVCHDARHHDAIDAETALLRRKIGCRESAGG
jgi:hypothetical protein